jgi:hypothetical protein
MDPYLEAPDIWPDVHNTLASEIRQALNQALPAPYYARLEMRPEVGIVDEEKTHARIIPDVSVIRHPRGQKPETARVAVRGTRAEASSSIDIEIFTESISHYFVEIRDASRNHHLVTLIEILSPSNKRPGKDRLAYRRKQEEILDSDANLIEIDLLRAGERVPAAPEVQALLDNMQPPADYLVIVNRAWNRLNFQLFPATLREWLPCIPVPLKEEEPEILLDLQYVFNRVYDTGPYLRGAIDYSQPPRPPLTGDSAAWAADRVAEFRC